MRIRPAAHLACGAVVVSLLAAWLVEPSAAARPVTQESVAADTCTIPAKYRGLDLERLPVTDKVVALTFDAGANPDGVDSILATLRARHIRGTFLLTGAFVNAFPVRSRQMAEYLIGNHTMTHPDLTKLTDSAVRQQVLDAQSAILRVTGQDPRRIFRFPFGARDARTIGIVNSLCYVAFRWTVDSLGWQGTSGGMTVQKVVDRVVSAAQPGEIVLMHVGSNPDDGSTLDADALPTIITRLRTLGYSFVTFARILNPAP
ncbi:MAG: polysaccharide deacetylase family protein [Nocardioidaceae bacterium]